MAVFTNSTNSRGPNHIARRTARTAGETVVGYASHALFRARFADFRVEEETVVAESADSGRANDIARVAIGTTGETVIGHASQT